MRHYDVRHNGVRQSGMRQNTIPPHTLASSHLATAISTENFLSFQTANANDGNNIKYFLNCVHTTLAKKSFMCSKSKTFKGQPQTN